MTLVRHLPLYFARQADRFRSDEAGRTIVKKIPRKGKPSEKMGRKATDPTEQNVRKAELPGGPLRYRVIRRCGVETAPLLAASRTVREKLS